MIVDSYNTFDLHCRLTKENLKFPQLLPIDDNPYCYIVQDVHTWCIHIVNGEMIRVIEMYGNFGNPMRVISIHWDYGNVAYYKKVSSRQDVISPHNWQEL